MNDVWFQMDALPKESALFPLTPALSLRERILPNGILRFEPLNRSSRREEALIVFGEFRWSLLTSAATRFMGRGSKSFRLSTKGSAPGLTRSAKRFSLP